MRWFRMLAAILLLLGGMTARADDSVVLIVVSPEYPLTLENMREESGTTVLWGSAVFAGETLEINATLSASGTGGLVLDDNDSSTPALYLIADETTWRLRSGDTQVDLSSPTDEVRPFRLSFSDETDLTIDIAGERVYSGEMPAPAYRPGEAAGLSAYLRPGSALTIDNLTISGTPIAARGSSLAELTDEITIGTALDIYPPTHDPMYEALLRDEVDLIAPVDFYWPTSRTEDGGFDFRASDVWVNFAQVNHKRVRGYHLIWDFELPEWLNGQSAEEVEASLIDHVETIVGRYRGRVDEWVVVNEAIWGDLDTGESYAQYAQNIWYDAMGQGYIETAFRAADAADPDAVLLYNETGIEPVNRKSGFLYLMMRDFIRRGVPVDGVGLQMHIDVTNPPDPASVVENMERFAALGLDIYFTEMDVNLIALEGTQAEIYAIQAQIYRDMLEACWLVSACKSYTVWSLSDHYAWYEQEGGAASPALFDEHYQPKPAYLALYEWLMQHDIREAAGS